MQIVTRVVHVWWYSQETEYYQKKIKTIPIIHSYTVLYTHVLVKLFIVDDGSKYSYSIFFIFIFVY
jgi:hypothetical protein